MTVSPLNVKPSQLWFIFFERASVDECKDGVSWSSRLEALMGLRKGDGDDMLQFPIAGHCFLVRARYQILSGCKQETRR